MIHRRLTWVATVCRWGWRRLRKGRPDPQPLRSMRRTRDGTIGHLAFRLHSWPEGSIGDVPAWRREARLRFERGVLFEALRPITAQGAVLTAHIVEESGCTMHHLLVVHPLGGADA